MGQAPSDCPAPDQPVVVVKYQRLAWRHCPQRRLHRDVRDRTRGRPDGSSNRPPPVSYLDMGLERLLRGLAADVVHSLSRARVAQEPVRCPDDQCIAGNLHLDHVEWLRSRDTQALSLADRVRM